MVLLGKQQNFLKDSGKTRTQRKMIDVQKSKGVFEWATKSAIAQTSCERATKERVRERELQ